MPMSNPDIDWNLISAPYVTNLEDAGSGSFRSALATSKTTSSSADLDWSDVTTSTVKGGWVTGGSVATGSGWGTAVSSAGTIKIPGSFIKAGTWTLPSASWTYDEVIGFSEDELALIKSVIADEVFKRREWL
jgi:hypothetical protein